MTDQTPPAAAPQPAAPLTAAEDKQWAMWAHFGGILWILPSLIIFLVFKDRGTLTKQESKEALNWQITFLIFYIAWAIIGAILTTVLIASGAWGILWIPSLVGWLIYLANVLFSVMGGVKVNGGGSYRYPVNFRFIK
ncbi:MAG: DUF4870 domain-containing protein [Cryobacterium sp.]|nr:DUF4870 domain-containing protein [Micrococcales bacterium]MBX3079131.1 DUF4870 domain-containing protein [Cryobacterium sp.]MBX3309987.1 DUF4870 domain-containing protein [Cryobacterium sp.]MCB1281559.1 DUF4870 domain-containing protein [Salinibacterium sp.]HNP15740.1 DUF4870 domain-containing protein [Terrimesophilobacter sp.]